MMESEAEYLMQAKLNYETRWTGVLELISENVKTGVIGVVRSDWLEQFLTTYSSDTPKDVWASIRCSMLSCHDLYNISAKLAKVMNVHDQPFGGINMIFAGHCLLLEVHHCIVEQLVHWLMQLLHVILRNLLLAKHYASDKHCCDS